MTARMRAVLERARALVGGDAASWYAEAAGVGLVAFGADQWIGGAGYVVGGVYLVIVGNRKGLR